MAVRGFIRALTSQGSWLRRLALYDGTAPVYPPLHISETAAPTATAVSGDIYVDTNGVLQVYNGTNWVPGGGGNVVLNVPVRAAAEAVDQYVFIADRAYQLVSAEEIHVTAGNDAGAVTADIVKTSGTTAVSSGTTMITTAFDLKSTAATTVSATLSATAANTVLADGDKIGINVTGTPTSYAGGVFTIVLRPI